MVEIKTKTGFEIWEAIEHLDTLDNDDLMNRIGNLKFISIPNLVKIIHKKQLSLEIEIGNADNIDYAQLLTAKSRALDWVLNTLGEK